MRIEHYRSYATWHNDTSELGENQHGTLNMHVSIYQARSNPTPLQIALFFAVVTLNRRCTMSCIFLCLTHANDQAIDNSDISLINLSTAYIHQIRISQYQISGNLSTSDLYAPP